MDDYRTEAQAVAELTARPELSTEFGIPMIITPHGGYKIVEEALRTPIRMKGRIVLRDLKSFLAFTKAKALGDSEILLSATGAIHARLDIDAGTFREYGAKYVPACSQSFLDWTKNSGDPMNQADFALFIERHIGDIHPAEGMPTATDLLTFCSTVEDAKRVEFKKSVSLQDGRVELVYAEKTDEAREQKLALFREFSLALRPFLDREQVYAVTAALRFRIREGQITFWYELKNIEALMEKLRADIRTDIEASGLPVYLADLL